MMKLKYLFDNRDLANMLLGYWLHDGDQKDIMDQYRISANAVYPYYDDQALCFLRFAPLEEKPPKYVRAELDFLSYLKGNGFPAACALPSSSDEDMVLAETPWGKYVAVSFASAGGECVAELPYSESVYTEMGSTLGRLHQLSAEYQPGESQRPSWKDRLAWCRSVFDKYQAPESAIRELATVEEDLSKLSQIPGSYGLIHYDFEPDNLFYHADSDTICAIDFDDATYHWFAMDVIKSIGSIHDVLQEEVAGEAAERFLAGYKSIMILDEAIMEQAHLFRRYAGVFTYARILRCSSERWNNEPQWMQDLRGTLGHFRSSLESSIDAGHGDNQASQGR